jgi:hypothetical protein
MLIHEAVAALGYEETPDQTLCIAAPIAGRMEHRTLAQCGERDLENLADVYIATGAFKPGSITAYSGRTRENLVRVYDLAFDFDLTDYTGLTRSDLVAESDATLEIYLRALQDDGGEVLSLCGIPITTWVSTGYGLLALARLATPDQTRLEDADALHKHLVTRVNEVHGSRLADPGVNDAGTRLVRLPGCVNTKGTVPRPCRILHELDGDEPLHLDAFTFTSRPKTPPRRIIPAHSKGLDKEAEDAIVLAINNDYIEGSRHGIALGVAGMLAKSGLPRAQTERIITGVAGGDSEIRDRLQAVATTYDRIERGLDVKGYTHLQSFLSPAVLAYVDNALEPLRVSRTIDVDFTPVERVEGASIRRALYAECPEEAFCPWFQQYYELMRESTNASPAFHLAASLVYVGATMGRSVYTDFAGPLFPNLFTILVGRTGRSRKSTVMRLAKHFFDQRQLATDLYVPPFHVLKGATSGEGILDQVDDKRRVVLAESEFSTVVRRARRQGTTSLMPTLMELYDMDEAGLMRAKDDRPPLINFFFSMIGGATPRTLAKDVSAEDVESGFANRVLWIFGQPTGWMPTPRKPDLARCQRHLQELLRAIELCQQEMVMDDQAMEMWMAWDKENDEREPLNDEDDDLSQRMGTNMQKVALINAASEGAAAIGERHLGAAKALVEWSAAIVREQSQQWGWDDEAKLSYRIKNYLAAGAMTFGDLDKALNYPSPVILSRILDAMAKNNVVGLCAPGVWRLL